jgi:hypothetical protein
LDKTRRYRGKGVKDAMLHVNVRLPQYVVDHFKESPSYTQEIRRVLETHVNETQDTGTTKVALYHQRWQDILAEENKDE